MQTNRHMCCVNLLAVTGQLHELDFWCWRGCIAKGQLAQHAFFFANHRSNKPSVRARMPEISNQKRSHLKPRQTALGLRRRCLQCPLRFGWHLGGAIWPALEPPEPEPTELGAAEQLIEGILAIIILIVCGRPEQAPRSQKRLTPFPKSHNAKMPSARRSASCPSPESGSMKLQPGCSNNATDSSVPCQRPHRWLFPRCLQARSKETAPLSRSKVPAIPQSRRMLQITKRKPEPPCKSNFLPSARAKDDFFH